MVLSIGDLPYALGHADLGGCQPNARGVIHGLEHIGHEPGRRSVDRLYGRAFALEAQIWGNDDLELRHGREIRPLARPVNSL